LLTISAIYSFPITSLVAWRTLELNTFRTWHSILVKTNANTLVFLGETEVLVRRRLETVILHFTNSNHPATPPTSSQRQSPHISYLIIPDMDANR
jgi:hypothetical protein